jgi:hypothetical protein
VKSSKWQNFDEGNPRYNEKTPGIRQVSLNERFHLLAIILFIQNPYPLYSIVLADSLIPSIQFCLSQTLFEILHCHEKDDPFKTVKCKEWLRRKALSNEMHVGGPAHRMEPFLSCAELSQPLDLTKQIQQLLSEPRQLMHEEDSHTTAVA